MSTPRTTKGPEPAPIKPLLPEDWLAVAVAFLLILLAALGLLGPNGLNITF